MNIIDMAREAGMDWQGGFSRVVECATQPELERFAALVRAAALEEAAGVCDEQAHDWHLHAKGGPVSAYNAEVSGAGTASAGLPGYAAGGNGDRK